MACAWTCGLETECKELLSSLNSTAKDDKKKCKDGEVLITYKNRMFYDFLYCHCMPPFRMKNAEGKHRGLAFAVLRSVVILILQLA